MKKMVLMVAVMMIAAPAMATIFFAVTDNEDGTFTISYTSDAGDEPRGVAIKVTVSGNNITGATNQMPAFNANIDDLYDGGVFPPNPNDHALAKEGAPGRFVSGNVAVISAGVLDTGGNQGAAPSSGDLITIVTDMVEGETAAYVSLTADGLRGPSSGVVGSVIPSNLDPVAGSVTDVEITFPEDVCYTGPDTDQWEGLGSPLSWCNPYQCHGDAGNDAVGGRQFRVTSGDLTILLAGWRVEYSGPVAGPTGSPEGDQIPVGEEAIVRADFDHIGVGGRDFRVASGDLTIMLAWWRIEDMPADCNSEFPEYP